MTTPAFQFLRPEPLDQLDQLFHSHTPFNLVSKFYQNLTTSHSSTAILSHLDVCSNLSPFRSILITVAGVSLLKCKFKNFLWFPIWLRMEIKALTMAPKPHQEPVSFLISTSSSQTLDLCNLCAHVNLPPPLRKAPVAVTRFPKDWKPPQSLRIRAFRKPHTYKSSLGGDSLFDEANHLKSLLLLQYSEMGEIKHTRWF